MASYRVRTWVTYEGWAFVEAKSEAEAKDKVEDYKWSDFDQDDIAEIETGKAETY